MKYTNRVGKTYYLREGTTKTGKPRYFFSSQQSGKGKAVRGIPEGYEIYEHPENAQVFLRKKRPRLITDIEEQFVRRLINRLERSKRYRVHSEGKCVTIYESNADTEELKGIFENILNRVPTKPDAKTDDAMTALMNIADRHYNPMLRFCLIDKEKRRFTAERFCSRGSFDDWIYLGDPDNYEKIVKKYVNILGTDEFFDSRHS
jgi:hypothetical protein